MKYYLAPAAGIEAAPRSGVGFRALNEEYSAEPGPDFLSGAAKTFFPEIIN
jgi:hypothetical protein